MFKPIWQTKGHPHFPQHGTTNKTSHPTCLFASPMLPLPSFTKKRNCHWVAHQRNQTSFHVRWHRHRVWVQQTIRLRTFACFRIRVSFVIRFCWSVSTLSCAYHECSHTVHDQEQNLFASFIQTWPPTNDKKGLTTIYVCVCSSVSDLHPKLSKKCYWLWHI